MSDLQRKNICDGICEAVKEFGYHEDECYVFFARSDGGFHSAVNGKTLELVTMLVMQIAAHPELKDVFREAIEIADFDNEEFKRQTENFRRELE